MEVNSLTGSPPVEKYPVIIDGRVDFSRPTYPVKSPWTRQTVAECCHGDGDDVAHAIESAERGARAMAALRGYQRAEILHRVADRLAAEREDWARRITLEGGKPIWEARSEAARAESTFRLAAEAARAWGGEWLPLDITPAGGDRVALVRRFPVGVITGISPFNFPLNLVAHKVAPALAAGNAIILKPASSTPLSAIKLGEALLDAGLPAGGCNVLAVPSNLAEPLIIDPRIKAVTFTGSAAVGWELKRKAFNKKVCLELGGNAAAIIEPDADLDHAVARCLVGGYAHTGQICISVQHILVNSLIYDRFIDRFVEGVKGIKMGDPLNEETRVAAMIDEGEARRLDGWIKEAVNAGARLLCGGERDGNRLYPAVLTGVQPNCKLYSEEAFGPVTIVSQYDRFEKAINTVNSWQFGLQTGIFTNDIAKTMTAFNRLEVGGVIIGDVPTFRVDNYPYGGVKQSGFGREGVKYAMEELSELRTLVLPAPR